MMKHPYRVVTPAADYTPSDLAWFRRPLKLAALLLVLVVAAPVANAQPRFVAAVVTSKVKAPKSEATLTTEHLDRQIGATSYQRDRSFHRWIKTGK
jgi:hypothetical protein